MIKSIEVDRAISPNDEMLRGNPSVPHYFSVGLSGLNCVQRALAARGEGSSEPTRILDFPCGHGRVLRYLRAAFPRSEITAGDLSRDGVDFCAAQFGAIPVYAHEDPDQIPLPRDHFDLIWVGSLVTHFDAPRWAHFLTFFRSLLRPEGVLVFSTHGRRAHERIVSHQNTYGLDEERTRQICSDYESTGFGYVDYPHTTDYGISFSDPGWVCQLVTSVPELRLVSAGEKAWDDHHDVYGCVRDTKWKAQLTAVPGPSHRWKHDGPHPQLPGDHGKFAGTSATAPISHAESN